MYDLECFELIGMLFIILDFKDLFYCELYVVRFCVCMVNLDEVFMFVFINIYMDLDEVDLEFDVFDNIYCYV